MKMHHVAKTKTLLSVACLAAILGSSAQASDSGLYFGAGLGPTALNDNGFVSDWNSENRHNGTPTDYTLYDTASGIHLYGGFKFNRIVSLEASYTNYGKFTLEKNSDPFLSFTPTSFSVSANLGYDFFDGQLRPFGLIGMSYVDLGGWSGDSNPDAVHIGLGLEYSPATQKNVGFRLAYEADIFKMDTGISNGTYVNAEYTQSLGMLYLGAHYRF